MAGSPGKRIPKLLTGQGQFLEGLTLPGMLHAALARSPYGSARITSVDVSAAAAADGVVAAYSGTDLADEWAAGLPMAWPVTDDIKIPDHWPVAQDVARYVGDAVAVVVATSRNAALDAAELVEVDYEVQDAVVDVEAALADDAPRVHESFDDNKSYTWALTNGDVDAAFAKADVVVKERYTQPRLIPNAMEPRAVVAQSVPSTGDFTVWSTTQIPHVAKVLFALTLGIPESQIRVIAPSDVGGGFGSKLNVYAEEALCIALARRLGKPVKWVAGRSEGYLATIHGRDQVQEIEIAATSDGDILGYRVNILAAMGAYLQLVAPRRSAPGRLPLLRLLRWGGVSLRVHGRVHEHDPDGRLPGRRAARGHLRDRAGDRLARAGGRRGPGGDPAAELPPGWRHGPEPRRARLRLGRLRARARPRARVAGLRRVPERPGGAQGGRRQQTDRRRLLLLRGDLPARAFAGAGLAEVRGGRLGTRPRCACCRPGRRRS